MNWFVACAVALGVATTAAAQSSVTTPALPIAHSAPVIDLYTFEVGEPIFQRFGHAAICVREAARVTCFNYGVTNFDDPPALAWGFIRTKQKFWVETVNERALLTAYAQMDRTIWRQRLPLSEAGARAIAARLFHDILPENREYYYDHFFNNCTTVLRDMINEAANGALKADSGTLHAMTFRHFGHRGLAQLPALLAITDFTVGRTLDRPPTQWEAMFHPDELRAAIEQKLATPAQVINARRGPAVPTTGPGWRGWMLLMAVAFALPLAFVRWRQRGGWAERLAATWAWVPLALWSIVIWTSVFVSSIPGIRWNEAVCLFVPLDLVMPFLSVSRRSVYARVRLVMVLIVALLCAIGVFRQPLWVPIVTAFLPCALFAFTSPRSAPNDPPPTAPPSPPQPVRKRR